MNRLRLPGHDGPIEAVVNVPGSKSIANRALLCAALAGPGTTSRIVNVPSGDDCEAMLDALAACGAVDGDRVTGGLVPGVATRFDARLAGTTSRFLTAVGVLSRTGIVVDGGDPLRSRPMGELHDALRSLGAEVDCLGETGRLPVRVAAGSVGGGEVRVRGDESSQFLSALMLVGPLLAGGLRIDVAGNLVSASYVEMTARVMRRFGARVGIAEGRITVAEGGYTGCEYVVEPDYSSAAFPLLALAWGHGTVRIPGLALARLQGDSAVLGILELMGVSVTVSGEDVVAARDTAGQVRPVELDLADASDLVPAVAVACAAAHGTSRITGVGFIRHKESNRIGDLVAGLRGLGVEARELDDGLEVVGVGSVRCTTSIPTHHDHRLAMAFVLPAAGGHPVTIDDPAVVSKSWPGYFGDMEGVLGAPDRSN